MRLCATLALLALSCGAFGQIYKSVDENGVVVFSDVPPVDQAAEKVDLPEVNSAGPPPDIPAPAPAKVEKTIEQSVEISAPLPDTTIAMGPGNFSVTAMAQPALGRGQKLQLTMDGKPVGEPRSSGAWQLTNVFRGAHQLSVSVVDAQGEKRASSDTVTVYVLRPSKNYKNR